MAENVGTITGTVFNDANSNGVKDDFETASAGTSVTLTWGTGSWKTITSAEDGSFTYTGPYATYVVALASSASATVTTTNPVTVTLDQPSATAGSFGVHTRAGIIAGSIFADANSDGVKDASEDGVAGVAVTLTQGSTVEEVTTDSSGAFTTPVLPGEWTVTPKPAAGWHVSTGNSPASVTVADTQTSTVSFGLAETPMTVSGKVYVDGNADGVFNGGDRGLVGSTVTLTSGSTTLTATSDSSGLYSVEVPSAGDYSVTFTPPAGRSAIDYSAATSTVTVGLGDTVVRDVPVSQVRSVGISGKVTWRNTDPVQPAAGVQITVTAVALDGVTPVTIGLNGSPLPTVTTAADGTYVIGNLDLDLQYTVAPWGGVAPIPAQRSATGGMTGIDFTATPAQAITVPGGTGPVTLNPVPPGVVEQVTNPDPIVIESVPVTPTMGTTVSIPNWRCSYWNTQWGSTSSCGYAWPRGMTLYTVSAESEAMGTFSGMAVAEGQEVIEVPVDKYGGTLAGAKFGNYIADPVPVRGDFSSTDDSFTWRNDDGVPINVHIFYDTNGNGVQDSGEQQQPAECVQYYEKHVIVSSVLPVVASWSEPEYKRLLCDARSTIEVVQSDVGYVRYVPRPGYYTEMMDSAPAPA